MEEIKEILIGMQKQLNVVENQQVSMQEQLNVLEHQQVSMQEELNEVKHQQTKMQESIVRLEEKQEERFREVNQRAVVFQEEITAKVNILLDADLARQELLDIHDSEITEIREEQFKHSARISRLETKVVGA